MNSKRRAGGGQVCFIWRDTGKCPYGASCKYRHQPRGSMQQGISGGASGSTGNSNAAHGRVAGNRQVGLCHEWTRTGSCRYGNACRYKHMGQGGSGGKTAPRRSLKTTDADLARFVKHLAVVKQDRVGDELRKSSNMWARCWRNYESLDVSTLCSMLEVLAKTPGSSSIEPPPPDLFEAVVKRFLAKSANVDQSDEQVLTAAKTVLNALSRSLDFTWTSSKEEVEGCLSNSILCTQGKLRLQDRDHRPVSTRLLEMLEDLEKPWRIKLVDCLDNETGVSETVVDSICSYDMWETATIEWLSNPEFFAPSKCPVMKTGTNGVYESAEDYMNCLHRLWVAMTFSDGHGALAPTCRTRSAGGNSCGSALWPISEGSASASRMHCRTRNCRNPIEFSCRIKNHDALCSTCASRSIKDHLGPPSPTASTHIYDCKVKSVETGGTMYLVDFKCRNAPQKAVHWRTTKRLSPPNLVGVVGLRKRGAILNDSDRVIWAEIVYHGRPYDEDRRRQNGDLAVNLSSIVEFDPDYFEEGSHVAVIDCMCFVPEWVPVLRAITAQKGSRLPFDNGRHLNLCLDQPICSIESVLDHMSDEMICHSSSRRLIESLVEDSQLEPVREIRRDPTLKDKLVVNLTNLVTSTTLDRMQLVSFLDALQHPVHLTQGPPGTGKSYLGVVLVRALIVIRNLWLRKSRSTAASPILVLSYKNHAIDEFLVDLCKAEPSLSRAHMIRIGGQCKDTRLAPFSERIAYHADAEVKAARDTVDKLLNIRESLQATLERDVCSFLSHRDQMNFGEDMKQQRKASYTATDVLMRCIVQQKLVNEALSLHHDTEDKQDKDPTNPKDIVRQFGFLALDDQKKPSRQIQRTLTSEDGTGLVAALVQGRSHYGKEHWGEIVLQWLQNKRPRPLCGLEDCTELAISPEIPFCDSHACHYRLSSQERCYKCCIADGMLFCSTHCCTVKDCDQGCLPAQNLCNRHACRHCVSLGIVAQRATELPPRNVCEEHPLCMVMSCLEPCLESSNYCEQHNTPRCIAVTKKGKPCKGTPSSRMFPLCRDHRHLAGHLLNADPVGADDDNVQRKPNVPYHHRRCEFRKRDGNQCKGTAMQNSTFCYDHSSWAETVGGGGGGGEIAADSKDLLHHKERYAQNETSQSQQENTQGLFNENDPNVSEELCEKNSKDNEDDVEEHDEDSSVTSGGSTDESQLDEIDEGTNLQHLRDVFEVEENDDTDSIESFATETEDVLNTKQDIGCRFLEPTLSDPMLWTWEMLLEDRWNACEALMDSLATNLKTVSVVLKRAVIVARKDFQQAVIRAKARVYENKSIIGGTMVGCISRLESIRKTRPFAVICEEASEVLEPLLFSCLSESTIKLEMIGDHRQLSPSIMDRYEFEIMNKVNVSLFQRLIESPSSHVVPSTVLSIQRRMRKNICDLTREFYADITEIQDHESCGTQVIGQHSSAGDNHLVSSATTAGREVQGISPHIFLWTHNGKQERSKVGVSRMNSHEAHMACSLAAYLVECGVPRTSIVILTPYKGQLMEMRNMLFKDPRFAALKLISKNPQDKNVIRLSTVDRFQGDEEDICIVSLVVDENSKTGFVKLKNRMVVLLSRARLGCFLLGNIKFFESNGLPEHWAKTFDHFKASADSDNACTGADLSSVHIGERFGPEIPLCCPVHREVVAPVSSPDALRLGFCTRICEEPLVCGHPCSMKCHWKTAKLHNRRCTVKLASPCSRHPAMVECHDAFKQASSAAPGCNHTNIMEFFQCHEKVDFVLKCGHTVVLSCFEETKILAGAISEPSCNRVSPVPYTFPSCGHHRDVTCSQLTRFQENPGLVKCMKEIVYESDCGHTQEMACWKRPSKSQAFVCVKKVEVNLPRCGHRRTVSCPVAQALRSWTGTSCKEIGVLHENISYGPLDNPCQAASRIERPCGHFIKLPCGEAFARVGSLDLCRVPIATEHPHCGHACRLFCHLVEELKSKGIKAPPCLEEFHEGQVPDRPVLPASILVPACTKTIKLVRACGHQCTVLCSDAHKPIRPCDEKISLRSPVCGHDMCIPCSSKDAFVENIWDSSTFSLICEKGEIPENAKPTCDMSVLAATAKLMRTCKEQLTITLPCSHKAKVRCNLLGNILASSKNLPKCETDATVTLDCGHVAIVKCHNAKEHAQGNFSIKCKAMKRVKCWNFETCGSILQVDCSFKGSVACCSLSDWTCPARIHTLKLNQCSASVPLDCPSCLRENASKLLLQPPAFAGKQELRRVLVDMDKDSITWLNDPLDSYLTLEKQLCRRNIDRLPSQESFSSEPIFYPKRLACFRVLSSAQHLEAKSFDPRRFAKKDKSFFGILTKRLSAENIDILSKQVQGDSEKTLLLGYASVVRVKGMPRGDQPPSSPKERSAFVIDLTSDDYDALSYFDNNGFENIVVWDPFPIVAVCRLRLQSDGLKRLALKIRDIVGPQLLDAHVVGYGEDPSAHHMIVRTVAQRAAEIDDDIESDDEDGAAQSRPEPGLTGTELGGLNLDANWTGGISSNGLLPPSVEKSLSDKMRFTNSNAAPFAGIKLLRELMTQIDASLLYLLLSIETIQHDENEARKNFDQYTKFVKASRSKCIHPWSLVVVSRLTNSKEVRSRLLCLFVEMFPTQKKCFNESEIELLKGKELSLDHKQKSSQELILEKWSEIKESSGINSKATEELLQLVGLRKVKHEVISLWKSALQLKEMDEETRTKNLISANYCFVGNPGTGKTTVCRLFAKILCESGVRSRSVFVETTSQKAKDGGTKEFNKLVQNAMGGVLFIDEAYDLDPVADLQGRPIVNELLTICENDRDKISCVLAGYEDDFQKKFFDYNVGLKSRFRLVVFDDFDEAELKTVWMEMRKSKRWSEKDGVASVASKRLAKAAGRKGFGNARAVRQLLESATKAAMTRLGDQFSMESMCLEIEDVIGEDPRLENEKLTKVLDEIFEKIGWTRVKTQVRELIDLCGTNYKRELMGMPPLDIFLNRMVLGNPGTGKTTFGKLYGRLLKELGFLSQGDVIMKTASDLVGSHVGESQSKTGQILEGAKGNLLIIDEAYNLDDNLYGKQVLDTLVEKVQGGQSDDMAVLLLGYEAEMKRMVKENNPGLDRRFPFEHSFYFDDYDDNELLAILDLSTKKQQVEVTMAFREQALEILQRQKRQASFNNAGSVELLLKGAIQKASKRAASGDLLVLAADDLVDPGSARAIKEENAMAQLEKLYKMEKVKEKLKKMKISFEVARRDGGEEPELGHFVFTGSPGTGKTTVARTIADILFSLSLKTSNVLVETSALELTGEYVGHTKTKVHRLLRDASGGVLFIDEAYNLGEGQFGKDACDTLVAALTSEEFRGVTVILAGYAKEINIMLDANPGLKSRFTTFFEFPSWEPDDCVSFFETLASSDSFIIDDLVIKVLHDGCRRLIQLKGWGNGRDVKDLWRQTKENRAERVYDHKEIEKTITPSDIQGAIQAMLQARIGKLSASVQDPLAELDKLFRMGHIKKQIEKMKKTWVVERQEGGGVPNLGHFVFSGSPGTGKTTVARAIARVLFGLELKASDKLVETTALEMTGDYVGQTVTKVNALLDEAKGGVLFIDEAYNFDSSFGKEAIDTIVAAMTSDVYGDVQIVIAGYPVEIDDMFRSNAGLKSRFTHFFKFFDWNDRDCAAFFNQCAEQDNFAPLEQDVLNAVANGCSGLITLEGWANGRDVRRLFDEAKSNRAERRFDSPDAEEPKKLLLRDVESALLTLLEARTPKSRIGSRSALKRDEPQSSLPQGAPPPVPPSVQHGVEEDFETNQSTLQSENHDTEGTEQQNESEDESDGSSIDSSDPGHDEGRDEGVPDDIWAELQACKAREQAELKLLEKLKEEEKRARREEENARRHHQEELERIKRELEKQEQERAIRELQEREARRRLEEEMRRKKLEEEKKRIEEERRRQERIKQRLRVISRCPQGFGWHKQGGGWRCGGGSHFVSDDELHRRFGRDV